MCVDHGRAVRRAIAHILRSCAPGVTSSIGMTRAIGASPDEPPHTFMEIPRKNVPVILFHPPSIRLLPLHNP